MRCNCQRRFCPYTWFAAQRLLRTVFALFFFLFFVFAGFRRILSNKLHYIVSISFLMEPNENRKNKYFVSGASHHTHTHSRAHPRITRMKQKKKKNVSDVLRWWLLLFIAFSAFVRSTHHSQDKSKNAVDIAAHTHTTKPVAQLKKKKSP